MMGFRSRLKAKLKGVLGKAPKQDKPLSIREALATLPKDPDGEGFFAVATSALLPEGKGNTFTRDGHGVAIFRIDGQLYAIDDACTHEDGPLGEGETSGTIVTCPYHDWRFDLETGECLSHDSRGVSCFAIREKDGFIWVGGRTRDGSSERGGLHDDGLISPQFMVD
jgi:nitrite reductase/ring-hydroxylating ferredoxin subunit